MSDSSLLENPVDVLDKIEKSALDIPQVECPVLHHFLPGFYIREFHAPAGTFIISKIHNTMHPWSISKGSVSVWDENHEVQLFKRGDNGITVPGTRRALYVHEDLVWTTAHAILETDLNVIEMQIIEQRDNPLLNGEEQKILNEIKNFHAHKPERKELP